jgi:hypothetical protein
MKLRLAAERVHVLLRQNYLVGLRTKVRCSKSFVVHQALSVSFRDEASHFKHVTVSRYL